jgi:hypothetical protein
MTNQQVILLFCVLFALIVGWSLFRALATGRISSRGWTFQRDKNPFWFWFTAIADLGILVGCLWFALYTLGLVGGLSIVVPFLPF